MPNMNKVSPESIAVTRVVIDINRRGPIKVLAKRQTADGKPVCGYEVVLAPSQTSFFPDLSAAITFGILMLDKGIRQKMGEEVK